MTRIPLKIHARIHPPITLVIINNKSTQWRAAHHTPPPPEPQDGANQHLSSKVVGILEFVQESAKLTGLRALVEVMRMSHREHPPNS